MIIALTNVDKSVREIAREMGCSPSTVLRWQKRVLETESVNRKVRTGKLNRKTNPAQDFRLYTAARNNPITTADDIAGNSFSISTDFLDFKFSFAQLRLV